MARYRGPKNRIARHFGVNIFGRKRNPLLHKPHPPGMHGAKRKKKSDYGVQLDQQQKLKAFYGMLSQSQLRRYYRQAAQGVGKTPDRFVGFLETRLDTVVYRLKFAPTPFAAQQLVFLGHVRVNGKRVDRRSFVVRVGMVISVVAGSPKHQEIINAALDDPSVKRPEYLFFDESKNEGGLLVVPEIAQVPWVDEPNISVVCEHLARSC